MSSALAFLLDPVRDRMSRLEEEIAIMDEQLPWIGRAPGTTEPQRIQLMLLRNIKTALHDALHQYCIEMEKVAMAGAVMHQIISCHLFVMKCPELDRRLRELYGQQSALSTQIGFDYQRVTNDDNESADKHLQMISLLYPYEFVVEILSNSEFVRLLLKTVSEYRVERHIKSITIIFNWIRKFRDRSAAAKGNHFFAGKNPMWFLLAEQFVTFFISRKMMNADSSKLRNFSAAEKCALIAKEGAVECGVDKKLADKLKEWRNEEQTQSEDKEYLRPMESQGSAVFSELLLMSDIEDEQIPCLRHVVLELKKMAIQTSPSAVLSVLSNGILWLKAVIKGITGQDPGADETLPCFVYCLSLSKPQELPCLVTFVEKYVDEALKETLFHYYVEQLKSSLEFIEERLLPVQPFVMFPCIRVPRLLESHVELVSLKPITVRGFEVWAFPTYSSLTSEFFPAMIRYTGANIQAKVYQYKVKDRIPLCPGTNMEPVPTLMGTFIQCRKETITKEGMIRIDNGDFPECEFQVNIISAMIQMLGGNIANPSVNVLDRMGQVVKRMWNLSAQDPAIAVPRVIAHVQKSLVLLDILPESFRIDGILNAETWNALHVFTKRPKGKFVLTPKVVEVLTMKASGKA